MLSAVICFVRILGIKVLVTMFLTLKPGFPCKTKICKLGPSPEITFLLEAILIVPCKVLLNQ